MTTKSSPYDKIKDKSTPLDQRLIAHENILRYGMPGCGEIARQERMAEALGDLCLAVAGVMTLLSDKD